MEWSFVPRKTTRDNVQEMTLELIRESGGFDYPEAQRLAYIDGILDLYGMIASDIDREEGKKDGD